MPQPLTARIEVEEDLYSFIDPKNGGGPQWCFGSTMVGRVDDIVYISGVETIEGVKPLSNVRWTLFRRTNEGPAELVYRDTTGRTREPSPIGVFPDGHVFVTANPSLVGPEVYGGPAEPAVFAFSSPSPDSATPSILKPDWGQSPPPSFNEHSYRSFAVDDAHREFIYFNLIGDDFAYWSFFDRSGRWSANGKIVWPRYGPPEKSAPLRTCYSSVALNDRAVYFFGVSDIVEPNADYKALKFKLTNSQWDYVFCRMLFTWTPDVTREPFRPWIEIANKESTRAMMVTNDLWLGPDGTVHLLWHECTLDERLRDQFFPGQKVHWQLNYAQIRDGRLKNQRTLIDAIEGEPTPRPDWGRFHVTASGKLTVVTTVSVEGPSGAKDWKNEILELDAEGNPGKSVPLNLEHAFLNRFFTAAPRAGSVPSNYLDLVGQCAGRPGIIRYARVHVE